MAKREVWHPAAYEVADVRAIQTLAEYARLTEVALPEGETLPPPSPWDVRRALDWIIHSAAQTYDNGTAAALGANDPYGRVSAFVDGRRSVGLQILKLMKLRVDVVEKAAKRRTAKVVRTPRTEGPSE